MKVAYEPAQGTRQVAEQAIRRAVQAKDNPADLINVALEELVAGAVRAARATRRWTRWPSRSATEVNTGFYRRSPRGWIMAARARLARFLLVEPGDPAQSSSTG